MSTERTTYARWDHVPLAFSVAALLGPGLHFIAFDGFSQPQVASDAAMLGVPIAGAALFIAAAALVVSLRRTSTRNELAWAVALALGAAAVWGSILVGDTWIWGPMETAYGNDEELKPVLLYDYGPQGDGTHLLVLANRSVRIDLAKLQATGLTVEDVADTLRRGFCSVDSPGQLKGVYRVLNSLDVTLIGISNGYPIYLEEVAAVDML